MLPRQAPQIEAAIWLKKRAVGAPSALKNWKKRYLVLRSNRSLSWYRSDDTTAEPAGFMYLSTDTVVSRNGNRLQVSADGRDLLLEGDQAALHTMHTAVLGLLQRQQVASAPELPVPQLPQASLALPTVGQHGCAPSNPFEQTPQAANPFEMDANPFQPDAPVSATADAADLASIDSLFAMAAVHHSLNGGTSCVGSEPRGGASLEADAEPGQNPFEFATAN